jgi:site-specific recombinase XerD
MNNKFPKINLIYNRYKNASDTKPAVVEIRVTYNYQQKYFNTGVWLYPNQWKKGKITNCEDIVHISKVLDTQVSSIKEVLLEMLEENAIDLKYIQDRLNQKSLEKITFIEYCEQRATVRKYGKEKDTQERYDRFIKTFSTWGTIKTFNDVQDSTIIAYDQYLAKQGMTTYSKWQNYHRFLNSFILDAVADGLLSRKPYKWINIEKGKNFSGINKCLTPEEFKVLKEAKMPTDCLEKVKDLFVFQTYTCLRYSDLARFNSNNITTINGIEVYKCVQKKTSKVATIPLLKPAMDILDKYRGFLPIISNVKYNEYLKVVAQASGINKPLSTHWARHTGATILLNEGVDMRIVSKICGHSSLKITEQVYAKLLDETVVKAIQDLEQNKLKSNKSRI